MDVLRDWCPNIDWQKFYQGPVSNEVWLHFKTVVQLCHAYAHWDDDATTNSADVPRQYSIPRENNQEFKRRQDAWKEDIRRRKKHRDHAKSEASEQVARLSYVGTNAAGEDTESPDWKLWFALRGVVNFDPRAAAFTRFDAKAELGEDAADILKRWLRQRGYSV